MAKKILVLLLFLISGAMHSQNYKAIDSLKSELQEWESKKKSPKLVQADTVMVHILDNICYNYYNFSTEKTFEFAKRELALSEQLNYKWGIASASNILGAIYDFKSDYKAALMHYQRSLKISKEQNNKIGMIDIYNNVGVLYSKMGNYPEALEHLLKGIVISKEIKDDFGIAGGYNNIGLLYQSQKNYPEALKNYLRCLEVAKRMKNNYLSSRLYQNIGNIYLDENKPETAMKYLEKGLEASQLSNDRQAEANNYNSIGNVYEQKKEYNKALENYLMALKIRQDINEPYGMASSLITIGNIYHLKKQYPKAIENINKGLDIVKVSGELDVLRKGYQHLSDIYNATGNYKLAFENEKLSRKINDSIFNTEKDKKITELGMTHEFEKKQEALKIEQMKKDALIELNSKKQRNTTYFVLLALFLVTSFAFGVYVNLKRNLKQKHIIEKQNTQIQLSLLEKETLLREIHHRVKNNLQIISSLLNIQSETIVDESVLHSIQEGQSRVEAMSLIHQNLYQSEQVNNVDIENYLKELVVYLSRMFENDTKKIDVAINASGITFDIDTAIPLGLIVNELVSNAYKYAFVGRDSGEISINIKSVAANQFELEVSNDGNELPEHFDIKKSKSLGLKLVSILSRQLRGSFSTQSASGLTSFLVLFKDLKAVPSK